MSLYAQHGDENIERRGEERLNIWEMKTCVMYSISVLVLLAMEMCIKPWTNQNIKTVIKPTQNF